jgi:hypothetical protein
LDIIQVMRMTRFRYKCLNFLANLTIIFDYQSGYAYDQI